MKIWSDEYENRDEVVRDYQKDFATCRGEAFMIEQVINNPNS